MGRAQRPRLIVVEDDPVTRSRIALYFADEGFLVAEAGSALDCHRLVARAPVDLLFIDIQLPDGSGLALAQELRAKVSAGIIFVTQRDSEIDRVVGLELAGDDYVTKPVNLRELLARARSLLRRRQAGTRSARVSVVTFGAWAADLTRRELATRDGTVIPLTRGEFDLLAALVEVRGQALSRDYLIEVVSNREEQSNLRIVDALVARLRRKLVPPDGRPVIATVAGIGYKLAVPVDSQP